MTLDTYDEDTDDVLDEFFDAQDIYIALETAGLVDADGNQVTP